MTMKRIAIGDFKLGPEEKRAINQVLDEGRIFMLINAIGTGVYWKR